MAPWVLIAGGFHRNGGMDRLNWALADYLSERGNPVHLVCHSVESLLAAKAATVAIIPRPGGSFMLGGQMLARAGRRVASRVSRQLPATRVVVNGGNCNWPDINWVHCVHHAWKCRDESAPTWFRLKNRCSRWLACRREGAAVGNARIVIANSERTRTDLINQLQIAPERICTVYPGSDSDFHPPVGSRRSAARAWLGKGEQPLVAFIGTLGYDCNKGFDVLFSAWRRLCARPNWDADLIVAGGGRALDFWRRQVAKAGLDERITMLGLTDRIPDLLAATDLLVSPVGYESYGLNVQEAICCGVPAMVTRSAGVAERYPAELRELLIDDPEDIDSLADRILRWRVAFSIWKQRIESFSKTLRDFRLGVMAEQIVRIATSYSGQRAA
jgi:glycosyltransferase involved in cell wall biosynthesis